MQFESINMDNFLFIICLDYILKEKSKSNNKNS